MKKTLIFSMAVIMLCLSVNAATVAYWRFEDGTNGTAHAGDNDDWYVDSSDSGNPMSTVDPGSRPLATDDIPFLLVPQTGADNTLALDFNSQYVQTVGSKPIDSYMFTSGWTIECTFKLDDYGWCVPVGKDGQPNPGHVRPTFFMKCRATDKQFQVGYWDDLTNQLEFKSTILINTGRWYSVAATYDGANVNMYIKEDTDLAYDLENSVAETDGVSFGQWPNAWSVGRGMHDGGIGDYFKGIVDEVRINDVALPPTSFLGVVPEPSLIIGGIALALLVFRRK